MSTLDEITKEKQRIGDALARVEAQREKLTGQLGELEAAERVLAPRRGPGQAAVLRGRGIDIIHSHQFRASLVASPQNFAGSLVLSSSSRLGGAEINIVSNQCSGCGYRFDLVGGFRYLDLLETLTLSQVATPLPGIPFSFAGQDV